MNDRPFSPPGAEIAEQAFDLYGDWLRKYSDELENVDPVEHPHVYSLWCDGHEIGTAIELATCA